MKACPTCGAPAVDRRLGLEDQKLWLCRWGTMSALVWAQSAENAELRVRRGCFDRRASVQTVLYQPVRVEGDVFVREATEDDEALFVECGIEVPA